MGKKESRIMTIVCASYNSGLCRARQSVLVAQRYHHIDDGPTKMLIAHIQDREVWRKFSVKMFPSSQIERSETSVVYIFDVNENVADTHTQLRICGSECEISFWYYSHRPPLLLLLPVVRAACIFVCFGAGSILHSATFKWNNFFVVHFVSFSL